MRLYELLQRMTDESTVYCIDGDGYLLTDFKGRDNADEQYNSWEVTKIRANYYDNSITVVLKED